MDKFIFGKYKDRLIADVADENPSYVIWAYENVTNPKHGGVDKDFYEACLLDDYENDGLDEEYLGVDMWGN